MEQFFSLLLERESNMLHQLVVSSMCLDPGGIKPQPRYVPDRKLKLQPCGSGMMLQPTERHWPGLSKSCFKISNKQLYHQWYVISIKICNSYFSGVTECCGVESWITELEPLIN